MKSFFIIKFVFCKRKENIRFVSYFIGFLVFGFLFNTASCQIGGKENSGNKKVIINGFVKTRTGKGKAWFNKVQLPKRDVVHMDSAKIDQHGQFRFSFAALPDGYYELMYQDELIGTGKLVLIDNTNSLQNITITIDTFSIPMKDGKRSIFGKSEIKGSSDNELLDGYFEIRKHYYSDLIFPLEAKIREQNKNEADPDILDSLNLHLKKFTDEMKKELKQYLLNEMGTSIAVFQTMSTWDNTDLEFMENVMNKFRSQNKNSFIFPYIEEKYTDLVSTSLLNHAPPLFSLTDEKGKMLNIKDFLGKKKILLDFWASWCGPCINEMSAYKNAYEKIKKNDILIISISTDQKRESWLKSLNMYQFPWLHVIDNSGSSAISKKYGIQELPTNFLIDESGIIIAKNVTLIDLLK